MPRITADFDDETFALLQRTLAGRPRAPFIRLAVIEKIVRDEMRAELAELRARIERIERVFGISGDA